MDTPEKNIKDLSLREIEKAFEVAIQELAPTEVEPRSVSIQSMSFDAPERGQVRVELVIGKDQSAFLKYFNAREQREHTSPVPGSDPQDCIVPESQVARSIGENT
ncbi:MAG: hypothetical protein AAGF93_08860 [Cyanobacteria bacterium P01_H01_bin.105]